MLVKVFVTTKLYNIYFRNIAHELRYTLHSLLSSQVRGFYPIPSAKQWLVRGRWVVGWRGVVDCGDANYLTFAVTSASHENWRQLATPITENGNG